MNTGVGCHALLQGIFLNPGIKPTLLTSPALAGGFFTIEPAGKLGRGKAAGFREKQKGPKLGRWPMLNEAPVLHV